MSSRSVELIHFAQTNQGLANQMARQPFFDARVVMRGGCVKNQSDVEAFLGLHNLVDVVSDNLIQPIG